MAVHTSAYTKHTVYVVLDGPSQTKQAQGPYWPLRVFKKKKKKKVLFLLPKGFHQREEKGENEKKGVKGGICSFVACLTLLRITKH